MLDDTTFIPGTGRIRTITGGNPAANTEAGITVPDSVVWRIIDFRVTLAVAVAVANRLSGLQKTTSGGVANSGLYLISFLQSGNYSYVLSWGAGAKTADPDTTFHQYQAGSLPVHWYAYPGEIITTLTGNLQAADDYAAPIMMVEEWVVPGAAV